MIMSLAASCRKSTLDAAIDVLNDRKEDDLHILDEANEEVRVLIENDTLPRFTISHQNVV